MFLRRPPFRWLRILLRFMIVIIGLFIIACLIFDHYVQFRIDDKDLAQIFREKSIPAKIQYYESGGRKLRYVSVGSDTLPTLLMLHGSPGSMSYYSRRYTDSLISKNFRVYTVDRPGYGYSGFGDPEPSIQKQAEMIRPILDSLNKAKHPILIMGGSYGSSIACRIAMDHPELVDGLILTGPSLAPGAEQMYWFTPAIERWWIQWFIPRMLRSANTEKYYHKRELEKMLPYWKNIKVPVAYIQGELDNLIDTSNAGFARRELVNAPYLSINLIKGREHRLAQFEWPAIRAAIMDIFEQAKKQPKPR
jgi:pimeloyl-ACP methyl ester carboxylesterase